MKNIKNLLLLVCFAAQSNAYGMANDSYQNDPWESFNRAIFEFNDVLDTYLLKPVAKGYRYVMPGELDRSVTNFFNNIDDVYSIANAVLQLKASKTASQTSRVMFNSTWGVAGLFDVATHFELVRDEEDLAQTLGFWGVPQGPYLVLPLLGPSSVRHAFGSLNESFTFPLTSYYVDDESQVALSALRTVDKRANLLAAESLLVGDKYTFLRNSFLQNRDYLVKDGDVEDNFLDSEEDESYLDDF